LVNEAEKPINSFYFVPSVTQRKNFKCASYVSPIIISLRNITHGNCNHHI